MSIPQLLHTMCAELSDVDLNVIRKARGFGAKETASRTSFASFYLTSIGVADAMAALEPNEAATLRLLHETGPVDISFFERLYGSSGSSYRTFTQRYKNTFDDVKKNLVRRGLVVLAEVKTRAETVQMERWRFALPPEFAPYLPSLPGKQNDSPGQQNDNTVRRKLLELVGGPPAIPNDPLPIHIKHGSIYLKDFPFSLATFGLWQDLAWQRALNVFKPNVSASLAPTQAVLNLLNDQTWRSHKDLGAAILIYSFGGRDISVEKLLRQGWELGLLSRLDIDRTPHYRLAQLVVEPVKTPTCKNDPYLAPLNWADTTSNPGSVKVDLRLISLHNLDLLNTLAHLAVENGALLASPSLVKLGRAAPAQRRAPLSRWLAENVSAFGKTLATAESKWGKTILHENLLFAQVRDLSLRVQLERELKEKLVLLSDHFIAFPQESRSNVEKVLKKAGFVVKTVKP
ncbi:MAG: hypothetical protein L6461_23730 [Anaerolineae bacterium]|nr:hypothetical protein [Anaerolineae bacterium]